MDRQDEGGVDCQVKPGGAAPTQRPPGNCWFGEKKRAKEYQLLQLNLVYFSVFFFFLVETLFH